MSLQNQLVRIITKIKDSYRLTPQNNNTQSSMTYLKKLFSKKPNRVANYVDELIKISEKAVVDLANYHLLQKVQILELIVLIVQKYTKLGKNNEERATRIFRLMINMLCSISSATSQNWMNPPKRNTSNQVQDFDSQTIIRITDIINSFANAITFGKAVQNLKPIFFEYVRNTADWRFPHAALIVASQISVIMANVEALNPIVQNAFALTEHPHPKVRFASLLLIQQFATALKNEFQEAYYDKLFPLTVKLLKDPVPRVVAQTFSCVSTFLENFQFLWKLQKNLGQQYIEHILHYVKTGSIWAKEEAILTLCYFAKEKDVFGARLPSILELAAEIITFCIGKPQYKLTLNRAFILKSMLLSYQEEQLVKPYQPQFITQLLTYKDSIDQYFFIMCWYHLCWGLQEFTHLSETYRIIFEIVKRKIVENENENVTLCTKGLKVLELLLQKNESKAGVHKYISINFAKQTFANIAQIQIIKGAIMLLTTACTASKPNQPNALPLWLHQTRRQYDFLMGMLFKRMNDTQNFSFEVPQLLDAVYQLITDLQNYLSGDDLVKMFEQQLQLLQAFGQMHSMFNILSYQEDPRRDIDSVQQELRDFKYVNDKFEQSCQKLVLILLWFINQNNEPRIKSRFLDFYQDFIKIAIRKQKQHIGLPFTFTVQILDCFDYAQFKAEYPYFIDIFQKYVKSSSPKIRNIAILGYKKIFEKIPGSQLAHTKITEFSQVIKKAFMRPFPPDPSETLHTFLVDNYKDCVVSALGVLLKQYTRYYPTLLNAQAHKFWLSRLPLTTDKIEGVQQQEILIEMLRTNPQLIVNQARDLLQIVEIYAKFVLRYKGIQYKQIKEETKNSLLMIREWPLFQQSRELIWSSLSQTHRKVLTYLMDS